MSSIKLWKTKIPKISKSPLFFILIFILILITGWIFSGWPSFDIRTSDDHRFPPKIQEAEAGTVTVRIEAPAGQDCDEGNSPISPNNPLCGFIPRTITIKAGDQIRFINNDPVNPHEPASDIHGANPQHQTYPELNLEQDTEKLSNRVQLAPSQSWTTSVLTRVGTWNYHDHLDTSFVGQITITTVAVVSGSGCDCIPPGVPFFNVSLVDPQSVNINWITDSPSLTRFEYGKSEKYGAIVEPDKEFRKSHLITLLNLEPSTQYYFRIWAEDKIGNKDFTRYANQTFITPDLPEKIQPSAPQPLVEQPKAEESKTAGKFLFQKGLDFGLRNDDVKNLQTLLAQEPDIYPEGLVTGYFGVLTEKAVKLFQVKYDIINFGDSKTTGWGRVGPKTRARLNELLKLNNK